MQCEISIFPIHFFAIFLLNIPGKKNKNVAAVDFLIRSAMDRSPYCIVVFHLDFSLPCSFSISLFESLMCLNSTKECIIL